MQVRYYNMKTPDQTKIAFIRTANAVLARKTTRNLYF